MRCHPTFFALSLLPLLVLAPSQPASAQPAKTAPPSAAKVKSEAATEKARELYNDGLKAYRAAQWEKARVAFLASWALAPHYQIAANLSDCELKTGHFRDAAEHAAYYAREMPADLSRAEKEQARAMLEQARAKIGTLRIAVDLEDAEVFVDAEHVGRAPLTDPIFVEPGHHVVEARLGGRSSSPTPVDVVAGGSPEIALQVKPLVSPLAPVPSVTPAPTMPVEPPRRTANTGLLVVGGGVAGAAFVTGIVATVLANGKASDVDRQQQALITANGAAACSGATVPSGCSDMNNAISGRDTFSNLAVWSFLGAGAFGAATVAYAIAAPKAGVRAAPMVGASSAGIIVGGAW